MEKLADFKKLLELAKKDGHQICSKVLDKDGALVRESGFALVGRIQFQSFTLQRESGESWVYFDRAKDWSFDGKRKAIKSHLNGDKMVFEVSKNVIVKE